MVMLILVFVLVLMFTGVVEIGVFGGGVFLCGGEGLGGSGWQGWSFSFFHCVMALGDM